MESTTTVLHPLPKKPSESAQDAIQFHSEKGSKAGQKIDPFAEQNARRIEKQKQRAKKRKKTIIASGIIGGTALILTSILIAVHLLNAPEEVVNNPEMIFEAENINESILNLNDIATNAYQNSSDDQPMGNPPNDKNLSAAEEVFNEAVMIPQNKEYLSQIYLSKIMFYADNGYYDLLISTINNVNPDDLAVEQKTQFYSYASMAYYYTGDEGKFQEYQALNKEALKGMPSYGG